MIKCTERTTYEYFCSSILGNMIFLIRCCCYSYMAVNLAKPVRQKSEHHITVYWTRGCEMCYFGRMSILNNFDHFENSLPIVILCTIVLQQVCLDKKKFADSLKFQFSIEQLRNKAMIWHICLAMHRYVQALFNCTAVAGATFTVCSSTEKTVLRRVKINSNPSWDMDNSINAHIIVL
jgi:hypothetical protein